MAENSSIEWTDHTFNPWIGCTKVHDGCRNCYAESMMDSRLGTAKWGPSGTRMMTSDANWRKPLQWNREAEKSGVRAKVFCASLADVFEDWSGNFPDLTCGVHGGVRCLSNGKGERLCTSYGKVASQWPSEGHWRPYTMIDARERLFALIDATPHLDWLLLTKRPENIRQMWPDDKRRNNVSLGTSLSTQEHADKQTPELLMCWDLAANLFLSIEPMLGPIDLRKIVLKKSDRPEKGKPDVSVDCLKGWYGGSNPDGPSRIDWVIVGGESGHGARPMHPEWVRSIRDQCVDAGVPFFFKQWGEWIQIPEFNYSPRIGSGNKEYCRALAKFKKEHGATQLIDPRPEGWDGNLDSYGAIMDGERPLGRVGKKAAGRLLDGVEWSQFPQSSVG